MVKKFNKTEDNEWVEYDYIHPFENVRHSRQIIDASLMGHYDDEENGRIFFRLTIWYHNTMNLYNFHTNPETLYGYDMRSKVDGLGTIRDEYKMVNEMAEDILEQANDELGFDLIFNPSESEIEDDINGFGDNAHQGMIFLSEIL